MKPILKGLIITLITISVVIPAGYFAFHNSSQNDISMAQVVPGNSTLVIAGTYNNTPAYIYNSSGASGVVLGVDLSGFSSQVSTASNTSNGTHPVIQPSLFATYRGYNIYKVENVTLEGLIPQNYTGLSSDYNISFNATNYIQNNTIYVASFTNVVSLGSYNSVVVSINTLLDKTGFQALSNEYFNSTANVSLYYKNNSSDSYIQSAVVNVFYMKSTFNIQMNNDTSAQSVMRMMSGVNTLSTNYTFFYPDPTQNQWVNGTLAVGLGNYYHIQYLLDNLPSNFNYTQLIAGTLP